MIPPARGPRHAPDRVTGPSVTRPKTGSPVACGHGSAGRQQHRHGARRTARRRLETAPPSPSPRSCGPNRPARTHRGERTRPAARHRSSRIREVDPAGRPGGKRRPAQRLARHRSRSQRGIGAARRCRLRLEPTRTDRPPGTRRPGQPARVHRLGVHAPVRPHARRSTHPVPPDPRRCARTHLARGARRPHRHRRRVADRFVGGAGVTRTSLPAPRPLANPPYGGRDRPARPGARHGHGRGHVRGHGRRHRS